MTTVCLNCGKKFEGTRRFGLCSDFCRDEHARKLSAKRAQLNRRLKFNERRCPDCQRVITDYRCPKCWSKRGRPADAGGFEEYSL